MEDRILSRRCPLCTNELRFYRINFEESILLCADESCVFPFGREDLNFLKDRRNLRNEQNFDSERQFVRDESGETNRTRVEKSNFTISSESEKPKRSDGRETRPSDDDDLCDIETSNLKSFDVKILNRVHLNKISKLKQLRESLHLHISENKVDCENPNFKKSMNLLSMLSRKNPVVRKTSNCPVPATKCTNIQFLKQTSRFPKFSFETENVTKKIVGNTISTNDEECSSDTNVGLSPEDYPDNDNCSARDFLNEFIENVCSQNTITDCNNEINDDFLNDLIGM